MAKKKKFSREFLVRADKDVGVNDVDFYTLADQYMFSFCSTRFRRLFKLWKKDVPLDKLTKVRVDITILE